MRARPKSSSLPALSPVMINRIAKYLFNGFDDLECSVLVNLPISTIRDLRSGKSDLRVKKSTLILKNSAIERIKAGRGKLSGLQWFLERRFPREYSKPEVQLTLASGTTTNNTLIVSAEVAEKLVNRSKDALKEIDALIASKQPEQALDG